MSILKLNDGVELQPYPEGETTTGYWFRHPVPSNELDVEPGVCTGRVPITGPQAWTVEKANPLTLSPSVHCVNHNFHGFVRDGKWVSA